MMHCDQVFEILTRGPFPAGAVADEREEQVERHLAACHECRMLAEALRPAVELLQQCAEQPGDAGLPAYRGRLGNSGPGWAGPEWARPELTGPELTGPGLAERVREALAEEPLPRRPDASATRAAGEASAAWRDPRAGRRVSKGPRASTGARGLAAAAVLAACSAFFLAPGLVRLRPSDRPSPMPAARDAARPDGTPSRSAHVFLAALNLPDACRDHASLPGLADEKPATAHPSGDSFLCCTHCHAAGRTAVVSPQAIRLTLTSCGVCHASDEALASAQNL